VVLDERAVSFLYARAATRQRAPLLKDDLARTVQCDGMSVTRSSSVLAASAGCWVTGDDASRDAARGVTGSRSSGLQLIAPIFAVERASMLAGEGVDRRRERREADTRPLLDRLRTGSTTLGIAGPKTRSAKHSAISTASGSGSASSSRTATSRRRTTVASASSEG
jgi:hypothetical protein